MARYTLIQSGDFNAAENIGALAGDIQREGIVSGLGLSAFDSSIPEIDVSAGKTAHTIDSQTAEATTDNGTTITEQRDQVRLICHVDAQTLGLTDAAVNELYLTPQPDTDDSPAVVATTSGDPTADALKIGEVDTSNGTVLGQWNKIEDDGTLSFPDADAANAALSSLPAGVGVIDRANDVLIYDDKLSAATLEATDSITDPEGNTVTSLSDPVRVTEEASTFAESDVSVTNNSTFVSNGAVALSGGGSLASILNSISDGARLNKPRDVAIDGSVAYAIMDNRITSVDISDPDNLSIRDSFSPSSGLGSPDRIAIDGDSAYVTSGFNNQITSVNISNPDSLSKRDTLSSSSQLDAATGIDIDGSTAYVAAVQNNAVTLVDISNPDSLSITNSISDSTKLFEATAIVVDGTTAFVGGTDRITSVDISDSNNLSILDTVSDGTNLNNPSDIDTKNNSAYVTATSGNRVTSVNISDTANLAVRDSINDIKLDGPIGIEIDNSFAYVGAFRADTIASISISDPNNLVLRDTLTDSTDLASVRQLAIDGTTIFAGAGDSDAITSVDFTVPQTSGDALIKFDSGVPADIDSYDLATFQRTLDGETVTVDVEDSNGNVLKSDISKDADISDIATSTDVQLRANLSRNDASNNPTVDYLARRFTR